MQERNASRGNLERGARIMARLEELARLSEEPGRLTRRYLTPAHRSAAELVRGWMQRAGLAARIDALGSVCGRREGRAAGLPALVLASHIDTVIDGGKYDGSLGVLAALAVAEELSESGRTLPFALEVHAYGDEEGVRYPNALSTSMAVAGRFDPAWLARRDQAGIPMREAIAAFGGQPDAWPALARRPHDLLGYFELHIEQGPRLESANRPLGVVTGISSALRLMVRVAGEAGHAGTVPMPQRRDALTAAAEMALAVERIARERPAELVATVGQLFVEPGAVNVIPGAVTFSIDLRSPSIAARRAAEAALRAALAAIGRERRVATEISAVSDTPEITFDAGLIAAADAAIRRVGAEPLQLHSGAGHDAISFIGVCPTGMMFVRCLKGISHSPAESITTEDADIAVRAMVALVDVLVERMNPAAAIGDQA